MATRLDDLVNLQEQLARIDRVRVSTEKALIEIQKTRVDIEKVVAGVGFMPRAIAFQPMLAAALLGAGAAIAKLFFP